jgi:Glycine rich protein
MKPMEKKLKSTIHTTGRSCGLVCAVATVLQFGVLAGYAQTNTYLFTGSEMTITLNPGTYAITAYGAQGGGTYGGAGGLGAEMSAQFSFSAVTTLTLLVGGVGGFYANGGGGGGGSFVVNGSTPLVISGGGGGAGSESAGGTGLTGTSGGQGRGTLRGLGGASGYGGNFGYFSGGGGGYYGDGATMLGPYTGGGGSSFLNGGYGGAIPYGDGVGGFGGGGAGGGGGGYSGGGGGGTGDPSVGGGGGGGSYIDSSAVAVLTELSGVASPDSSPNGEIMVSVIPEPTTLALACLSGLGLLLFRRQRASDRLECAGFRRGG